MEQMPYHFYFHQGQNYPPSYESPTHNFESSKFQKDTLSFFSTHQLMPKHEKAIIRETNSENAWMPVIFVMALAIFTFLHINYNKRMNLIYKSVISKRYINQIIRETHFFQERISIFLFTFFLLVTALFIFLALKYYFIFPAYWPRAFFVYLIIVVLLLLVFFSRMIMKSMVAWIFKTQRLTTEYLHSVFLLDAVISILLFFLIVFTYISQLRVFIITGFVLLAFMMVHKGLRLISVGVNSRKFSVFYMILYLCTVEIIPIIILTKFVMIFLERSFY